MVSFVLFYYPEYVYALWCRRRGFICIDLICYRKFPCYIHSSLSFVFLVYRGNKKWDCWWTPEVRTKRYRFTEDPKCRKMKTWFCKFTVSDLTDIQTLQRILVSMERFIGLFSSFATCGSIGLSDYRCVKGSPLLGRGARKYFSSKLSISIIYVAVTKKPGTDWRFLVLL